MLKKMIFALGLLYTAGIKPHIPQQFAFILMSSPSEHAIKAAVPARGETLIPGQTILVREPGLVGGERYLYGLYLGECDGSSDRFRVLTKFNASSLEILREHNIKALWQLQPSWQHHTPATECNELTEFYTERQALTTFSRDLAAFLACPPSLGVLRGTIPVSSPQELRCGDVVVVRRSDNSYSYGVFQYCHGTDANVIFYSNGKVNLGTAYFPITSLGRFNPTQKF